MIIFINDDRAYLSWVRSHRGGFVLEARRTGHGQRLVHRSTCGAIRTGNRRHWTTGQQMKACSMSLPELVDWVRETSGRELPCCGECQPETDLSDGAREHGANAVRLSPLAGNILNYALETAIIHLTNGAARYHLTIGEVATCLHKTPAQLTQAIRRLLDGDFLTVFPGFRRDGTLAENAAIWPTVTALRSLDGYAQWTDKELRTEVARLGASGPAVEESVRSCHATCE